KFRSMRINPVERTGWTTFDDPRKTKFGSFLRKLSIDELPQFFNVLKGDMSLVGPRPEMPYFVEQFKESIPLYMVKHQVRPGITGWAQVNGLRGDTSIKKRIEHDIYYIENWNLIFDIRILFLTLFKGVVNEEKL
ncbi:sugar transferase, partial [Aminipila sp.]|uniref:sugar transferase n=1 Tax=Aminipila sp. TaxID=2060095 RepID=UPI00289F3AC1